MSATIRQASSDNLGIIHDIRRDAILGIESDDLGVIERQAWADRRSPGFFTKRVAGGRGCACGFWEQSAWWEAVQEATSAESTFVRHQVARELVVPPCRGWNPSS